MNREAADERAQSAPHVTEKTSLAHAERATSTRSGCVAMRPRRDVKQAVELMFDVKVTGVQVVNEPGKTRRFGRTVGRTQDWKKAYVRLAEGQTHRLRSPAPRPKGRSMALIKLKPTIARRARSSSRSTASHLHKGGPLESLTAHQNKTGARNHFRPHHHAPQGRRFAPEVPPHRLPSRQGRHRRRGRAARVRSEPHRAHRAGEVRRRRASLHPRAQGHASQATKCARARTRPSSRAMPWRCATSRSARSCTTSR